MTFKCKPAGHPRARLPPHLVPKTPPFLLFNYLLLFFRDMFQARNHEFRGQGTESEPRTPGLQGGDDL